MSDTNRQSRKANILDFASFDLALIAVLMTCGIYLTTRRQHTKVSSTEWSHNIVGKRIKLEGLPEHAMVVAISTRCPYCLRSMPFYAKILRHEKESGSSRQLVASMPQKAGIADEFLKRSNVAFDRVYTGASSDDDIVATPTLLLVDKGTISRTWVGLLTPLQQQAVLDSFDR